MSRKVVTKERNAMIEQSLPGLNGVGMRKIDKFTKTCAQKFAPHSDIPLQKEELTTSLHEKVAEADGIVTKLLRI